MPWRIWLRERQGPFRRLETLLHGFLRQHLRHAEVDRHVAQERDRRKPGVPIVVIDHDRGVRPVEIEDAGKVLADALLVFVHLLDREHVALGALAGRVADKAGRAAHEGDHLVSGELEAAEHHDGDEVPGLERSGGGVEAAIDRLRRLQHLGEDGIRRGLHKTTRTQFFKQRHFVPFVLWRELYHKAAIAKDETAVWPVT